MNCLETSISWYRQTYIFILKKKQLTLKKIQSHIILITIFLLLQVAQPLELKLSLKPQESMGGEGQMYAQLDMIVKCSSRYPDV